MRPDQSHRHPFQRRATERPSSSSAVPRVQPGCQDAGALAPGRSVPPRSETLRSDTLMITTGSSASAHQRPLLVLNPSFPSNQNLQATLLPWERPQTAPIEPIASPEQSFSVPHRTRYIPSFLQPAQRNHLRHAFQARLLQALFPYCRLL